MPVRIGNSTHYTPGEAYVCRAALTPEPEGGFSAIAYNLLGVGSQGDTEEEAIANLTEAFCGAIESYQESGDPIPWSHGPAPAGTYERHFVVEMEPDA